MNESILLIIKYLLKKKNILIEDQSIDSFFEHGTSFPIFVAKVLNLVNIPQLKKNPSSKSDCEYNNIKAFHFLLDNFENIKSLNPPFKTLDDKVQLLKLILTTEIFRESSASIIKKLNLTFEPLQIRITNEKELYNFKNISALLNIFTSGIFPITNFFNTIFQNCSKCEIPLVIKEDSLQNQNTYIFLIQVQIFFDFFSGCDHQLLDSIKEKLRQQIMEKSDNNSKNDTEPLENNNFNKAINFWNYSPDIYSYSNGILVLKTLCESYYAFETTNSIKYDTTNNFCQLFRFDETSYRWRFCEECFENFFSSQKQDPIIPLALFMDSDFLSMKKYLAYFKKDILSFDFGDEISVFAFRDESDEAKTNERMYFLFVHVPRTKIHHQSIRTILYQIYTFLYLTCDMKIVFVNYLNSNVAFQQVDFVSHIINISNMYLKSAKQSNGEMLFLDHSQLFLFLSDAFDELVGNSDTTQQHDLLNEQVKKKIEESIKNENHYSVLNSDKDFEKCLSNSNLANCYRFSHLKEAFLYSDEKFSELNELYIFTSLFISNDDQPNFIRSIIDTRFDELFTAKKYHNAKGLIIEDLRRESEPFYPKCDVNFSSIFENELLKKSFETDQFDKDGFVAEFKKTSQNNLNKIVNSLKLKGIGHKDQIDKIKKCHESFLKKQFFELIKNRLNISPNILFDKLYYLLQLQIEEDNEKILQIVEEFEIKDNNDATEKFNEANKKSGNYVVNEIEKSREIEINIDSEDDLDRLIQQDF